MSSEPVLVDDVCTVYLADALDVLPALADDSVDAVVTDPPYGLGFMGKKWDSAAGMGDHPMRRFAELDAVNAGASRQGGRQRQGDDFARRQARDARTYGEWCETWASECLRVLKPGGHLLAFGGTRTAHRLASGIEDAGFELRDTITWLYGQGFPKSKNLDGGWQGWGTALKPSSEPIVVARKSLVGSVAANVAEYSVGALNIDGCRIEGDREAQEYSVTRWKPGAELNRDGGTWKRQDEDAPMVTGTMPSGRWPTNVVLDDESAAALDEQTGTLTSGANPTRRGSDKFRDAYGDFKGQEECAAARGADSGGASRFYPVFRYEAKAGDAERPRAGGVSHPTVKPLDLMRWLVRLVTPPGGLVLDPFLGSGTTAEACVHEGLRCIGIERETEYFDLIRARLDKGVQIGLAL